MREIVAKPYAVPSAKTAKISGWWLADSALIPLPDRLTNWDYSLPVNVMCEIEVDPELLYDDSGCKNRAIDAGIFWKCTTTWARGVGTKKRIDANGGPISVQLTASIPSNQAGGKLELSCALVLAETGPVSPGCAKIPGSVLWDSSTDLYLEGTAARFPIQIVDFETSGLPAEGCWHLQWSPYDMNVPFMSNVCLLLNSKREQLVALTSTNERSTLFEVLHLDVARQLLRGALLDDDFLENHNSYSEGSTGYVISMLITQLFDNSSPNNVRTLLTERPEYFDTTLQSKLDLFR